VSGIVLTGWCGTTFAKIACHTLPLMEEYAGRHGMQFCCGNLRGERAPSWQKVLMIHQALQDFPAVVWIDADVVVMDPSVNIAEQLRAGTWQGLVEHDTESGKVPNCGVWVCTREMLPTLTDIWNEGKHLTHWWWEQAAILERMGYLVTDKPHATLDTPTTLYERTTFLQPTWNHHPRDARRVANSRFVHVTMYADRPAECRRLAQMARESPAWASAGTA
jgi:hypothetical protein